MTTSGAALETSLDVQFKVDLVKGFATAGPRAEMVDPQYNVVAKLPKSALAAFK
jgi:hypothetical protein